MTLGEFDLINRYFAGLGAPTSALALGIGDDCALLSPASGDQLAVSTDTQVAGVHFPAGAEPDLIARRCLRVNLSDLAAMGASPLAFQLALTLPETDEHWLAAFSAGLARDAAGFACPLSGGDTTRGPLSVTITALGAVATGEALRRDGARAGDRIYVTGTLGDARGALEVLTAPPSEANDYLLQRYWLPRPQLAAGMELRGIASAAIDISDGLLQDLGHITTASGLGAVIEVESLPLSPALVELAGDSRAREWALTGGDDYELCFTVPPGHEQAMRAAMAAAEVAVTPIGRLVSEPGVRCLDASGRDIAVTGRGYSHF